MKVCSKCNNKKEESEFYKNAKNKDRLNYHCKDRVKKWKEENKNYYIEWKNKHKDKSKVYRKTTFLGINKK